MRKVLHVKNTVDINRDEGNCCSEIFSYLMHSNENVCKRANFLQIGIIWIIVATKLLRTFLYI
jgi:hypothetical protein